MASTSVTTVNSQSSTGTGGYRHKIILLYYFDYNTETRQYTIYAREQFYHKVTDGNWTNNSPYNFLAIDSSDNKKCVTKNNLGSPSGEGTFDLCPTFKGSNWQNMGTFNYDAAGNGRTHTIYVGCGYASSWAGISRKTTSHSVTPPSIGVATYPVTYDLNGGSGTFTQQTKTYNTNLTLYSTVPTKTGYTFTGWFGSDGNSYAAGATFSGNYALTLTAQWSINSYYLDLNGRLSSDGGSTYEISGGIAGYGTVQVFINDVPQPGRRSDYYTDHPYGTTYVFGNILADTGHVYEGVYSGSTSGTIGAGNVSTYLQFRTNKYYIAYNLMGGTGSINNQIKIYGTDLILSTAIPSKSGYDFLGWDTSSSGTTVVYSSGDTLTSDLSTDDGVTVTLYAVWRVTIPSNVRFTTATATGPFNINLVWTCTGLNITNYTVYYKKAEASTYSSINCGTSTSLNLAVDEETAYDIYVTATNEGGTAQSGTARVITPADQAKIRIYTGNAWVQGKTWIYTGSTWVKAKKVYIYDGNQWKINSNN